MIDHYYSQSINIICPSKKTLNAIFKMPLLFKMQCMINLHLKKLLICEIQKMSTGTAKKLGLRIKSVKKQNSTEQISKIPLASFNDS